MTAVRRTLALCLMCLVPATAGLFMVVVHRMVVVANPFPSYLYGTNGSFDRFVITMVVPVIACLGGPLLGVAAGRWLRFPGASLLVVLALLMWCMVAAYLPAQGMDGDTLFARTLHMVTPYTAFGSGNSSNSAPTAVRTYTGSPGWFAVWTLALCVIAAATAVLRDAVGRDRVRVVRVLAASAIVGLVALVLSVATGPDHLTDSSRAGTTEVSASASVR